MPGMNSRHRVIAALLVSILVVGLILWLTPLRHRIDAGEVVEWLRSMGREWWAPLAYLLMYVVFTLLLVPPVFLSAAAALMWGWFAGGLIDLICATAASIAPYALARSGGEAWVRRQIERRGGSRNWERLQKEGFFAMLLLRLVPVIPYAFLNYLAGFASIRAPRYVLATFLGMIPSTFVFTYFVDALGGTTQDFAAALPRIFAAGAAIAVLVVLTRLAAVKLRSTWD